MLKHVTEQFKETVEHTLNVDDHDEVHAAKQDNLTEASKLRAKLDPSFKRLAALIGAVTSDVPDDTGDGSQLPPEEDDSFLHEVAEVLSDLPRLGFSDYKTLVTTQAKKLTGEPTDDRTYLMEGLIRVASKLPDKSGPGKAITDMFLQQLWNDLEHPPKSYLGAQFQYRSADGSKNSLVSPQLGAAGTPYARTVKPSTVQTPARPDAGVVFDSVMTRKEDKEHPNRISSMLFYLASIIIHDLFRTDHTDSAISTTSSYLDLSPLYGSNKTEQHLMRTFANGKLKPDCFSEARLLFFPPGVGALLITFNRFHNYVVENLAAINESGRFTRPEEVKDGADQKTRDAYAEKLEKFDEDLFQTGRLITCGLYVNIILVDYVRTILDLNRTDSNWQLNPRADIKGVPVATGNQVSAEFNLVYRWHSTLSKKDTEWTEKLWKELLPGRDPQTIDSYEFVTLLSESYRKMEQDPAKRPFADLKRNADGTLADDDLAKLLIEGIDDCAQAFGPNRVPAVMRAIEVLGIEQARSWNLSSLNEFRKYFGLEPHRTFEDITQDKYVAEQLKHLYDTPDQVEIYPGLVVEDAKLPKHPGSGLCPGYTISRAVLSDAVALVRGDRFYTIDYNPRTLTNWGYSLVDSDDAIDNGCVFYKLLLRALPQHFAENSVYAHYPLTVPDEMEQILKNLGKSQLYNFDVPKYTPPPHIVDSYEAATTIMNNSSLFNVSWGKAMQYLMGPPAKNFMLAGDGRKNSESREVMSKALYISDWDREVRDFYMVKTRQLLRLDRKAYKLGTLNQVDIIRDIGNLVHVHFCAEMFMLPLKTDEHPHGVFTESELYLIMAGVFALVFFDIDVATSFPLHIKARAATQQLGQIVKLNVEAIQKTGKLSELISKIWPSDSVLTNYGIHMIERLLKTGMSPDDLVWGNMLGTAGGMVSNQGQLFGQTLDYYLNGAGQKHWSEIQRLAQENDSEENFEKLMHYFLEGSRLGGETGVMRTATEDTTITDNGRSIPVKKGDQIFVNLRVASHDPAVFKTPDDVDLSLPLDSYIQLGYGPHQCLGLPMTRVALTTLLREVARLKNLRPAKGPQGVVHKVANTALGDKYPYHAYLMQNWDGFWPFPCSMKVNWDD